MARGIIPRASVALITTIYGVGAGAKVLRWSSDPDERPWEPAQKTMDVVMNIGAMSPKPTAPARLVERDNSSQSTCGFISGLHTSPVVCDQSSACESNSRLSLVGCCPPSATSCALQTTCYPSSDRLSFTTDNGFTLYCGDSNFPNCATAVYGDQPGYSILVCAKDTSKKTIFLNAHDTSTTSSPTSSLTSSSANAGVTTLSGTVTTATAISTATPDAAGTSSSSSLSTGRIISIVLGILIPLLLILLAACLCYHRYKKRQAKKKAKKAAAAARKARNVRRPRHQLWHGHHHHHSDDSGHIYLKKELSVESSPPASRNGMMAGAGGGLGGVYGGGLGIYQPSVSLADSPHMGVPTVNIWIDPQHGGPPDGQTYTYQVYATREGPNQI